MSLPLFTFGTRLRATRDGRAVLCGTANRVTIRPDALVVAVVAMGGEHSGTWGLAVGPRDARKPQKFHCADPSTFSLQADMWDRVERYVSTHIDKSLEAGVAPQIVVANNKCWEVLAETAGRLSTAEQNVKAATLAQWILYANERAALAGDPTVVRVADLLSSVYVCGGEPAHDANLQSVMAWIEGGVDLADRLEAALLDNECFLDPAREDAEFAAPFLKMKALQLKASREADGAHSVRLKNAGSYTHKLNGVLDRRWQRIREAVQLYVAADLTDIHETAAFADLAHRAWRREHDYRAEHPITAGGADGEGRRTGRSRYDSAREGNAKLAERSAYADQWARTLVWRDEYEQRKAFADGRLVDGDVVSRDDDGVVRVLVDHNMLRVRVGDELVPFDRPKDRALVRFLDQRADGTTIVGVADASATTGRVGYGPRPPEPFEITAGAIRRGRGLRAAGWTHYINESVPMPLKEKVPANILRKVNDARAKR